MHVHKWQRVRRPPTRLPFKKEKNKTKTKQKKQGPYFLWLQAGFRSLCPLIYQRTAVLRLCDDQSPLPSVSPTQSLSRSISSSSAPSFPSNLLSVFLRFSTSLIPPHSHWASCPPLFSIQIPRSLCALSLYSRHMDSFGICCFLLVHTHKLEKARVTFHSLSSFQQSVFWTLDYKHLQTLETRQLKYVISQV